MAFGPHLIMDCYGCSKKRLSDMRFIYDFLDSCPDRIGMTKITEPYIVRLQEGLAGVIIIAESHISAHTFPKEQKVSIDIFSCKEFEEKPAIKYILDYFSPRRYQKIFFKRGKKFPRKRGKA